MRAKRARADKVTSSGTDRRRRTELRGQKARLQMRPAPQHAMRRFLLGALLNQTTPVGFEPTRGDPIGLAGRRLSRSAKVSLPRARSEYPAPCVSVSCKACLMAGCSLSKQKQSCTEAPPHLAKITLRPSWLSKSNFTLPLGFSLAEGFLLLTPACKLRRELINFRFDCIISCSQLIASRLRCLNKLLRSEDFFLALSSQLFPCSRGVTFRSPMSYIPIRHRSHFGSRYKSGCCGHAGLFLSRFDSARPQF